MEFSHDYLNADRVLRLPDVCTATGLSRSSIYLRLTQGDFPKPIDLGGRSVGWIERDIQAWILSRKHVQRTSEC